MAITLKDSSIQTFYGHSTDTKPTAPSVGSTFYERDTGKTYRYMGQWEEITTLEDLADESSPAADTVTVGTDEALLATGEATLSGRRILRVFNYSGAVIFVGPTGVTTSTGYPILPNDSGVFYGDSDLYAISGSADCDVRVMEST